MTALERLEQGPIQKFLSGAASYTEIGKELGIRGEYARVLIQRHPAFVENVYKYPWKSQTLVAWREYLGWSINTVCGMLGHSQRWWHRVVGKKVAMQPGTRLKLNQIMDDPEHPAQRALKQALEATTEWKG